MTQLDTDTDRWTVAANGMIAIASRLIETLERETGLLLAFRPTEIRGLQDEKLKLTQAYRERALALKDNAQVLNDIDAAVRAELSEVVGRAELALDANVRALSAAKQANATLLQCIVDAVAKERTDLHAYAPSGARSEGDRRRPSDLSLTLDRTL